MITYVLYTLYFSDQDQKNIIDKLANFVARNGEKFEEMTKSKQKDNPKFSFLFGGEYFNYYKWKVSVEIGKLFCCSLAMQLSLSCPNRGSAGIPRGYWRFQKCLSIIPNQLLFKRQLKIAMHFQKIFLYPAILCIYCFKRTCLTLKQICLRRSLQGTN